MNLSPQDVFVIGWKRFSALVVGIPLISAFCVWLVSRMTKPVDAYAEKWGEVLAQAHTITLLVEQTKALTAATEGIKGQLSHEVWTKEQRWIKRLDAYTDVIEKLDNYRSATATLRNAIDIRNDYHGTDAAYLGKVSSYYELAAEQHNRACAAWIHAKAVAHLSCDSEAVAIVDRMLFRPTGTDVTVQMLEDVHRLICQASDDFVIVARRDLGYDPLAPVPSLS